VAAYLAANLGHYTKANSFVDPAVVQTLQRAHADALAASQRTRRCLSRLRGRRDSAAVRSRKRLQLLLTSEGTLARIKLGSPQQLRELWNMATRGRSLVRIEATRQVIQDSRARVYLRLTLRDGTVVRDSEPLVLQRGKWLLG
jgi:hypothetical protein